MLKKRYLFLILIICLFAISAVSATDNATSDIISIQETTDDVVSIYENNSDIESFGGEIDILTANSDGTFTDLANDIANANGEFKLTRNYVYDSSKDSNYKDGIVIDKEITINGRGFIINGNNNARAFNVKYGNVILRNIEFINCSGSGSGGAVYWNGADGSLFDCNFMNCYCSGSGGAVYWNGANGSLHDCNFINCYCSGSGGAVYWNGINGNLSDCNFNNCYVSSSASGSRSASTSSFGGAVYWNGINGNLSDCNFNNCYVSSSASGSSNLNYKRSDYSGKYEYFGSGYSSSSSSSSGGAVFWNGAKGSLFECNFTDDYTYSYSSSASFYYAYDGGNRICDRESTSASCYSYSYSGIYWYGNNGRVFDCSFVNSSSSSSDSKKDSSAVHLETNSSSSSYGGAVYWKGDEGSVFDCSFINTISHSNVGSSSTSKNGGAIYWYGSEGEISNSSFINCYVPSSSLANAVYWYGNDGGIFNCSFVKSTSKYTSKLGYNTIYWYGMNGEFFNSSFDGDYFNYQNYCKKDTASTTVYPLFLIHTSTLNNDDKIVSFEITQLKNNISVELYDVTDRKILYDEFNISSDDLMSFYTVNNLEEGEYQIYLEYAGDNFYTATAQNDLFRIGKNSSYEVTIGDCAVGGNATINLTLNEDVTGKVKLTLSEYTIINDLVNGKTSFYIPYLKDRINDYKIKYVGDEKYNPIYINDTFIVLNKSDIQLSPIDNITIGEDVTIDFNITEGVTGYIDVYVDSLLNKTIAINDSLILSGLNAGNHTITLVYSGDDNYRACENSLTFEVLKFESVINILSITPNPNNITFGDDVTINYIVTNGTTGNINLYIDSILNKTINIDNQLTLSGLNAGNHTITLVYSGDDNYRACENSLSFEVLKHESLINILSINPGSNVTFGDDITIDFNITDGVTGNIDVYVDSVLYKTINVNDSLVLSDLNVGNHTIKLVYNGDENYKASTAMTLVSVNKAGTVIYAPSVSIAYKDSNGELVASIISEDGKPLVVNLNVELNGKTFDVSTDSNGRAYIPISTLSPGKYTATISYKGSANYKASTVMALVTVTKAATVISAQNVNIAYKDPNGELVVSIISEHGKALVVSLNVELNGKTYTVRTDSNGQARLAIDTLSPGTRTATISYKGSSNYKASTATAKVTVTKADTIISAQDVSIAYKDPNGELVATITNEHGKALVVGLNVELNGKTYTVRTDSNGQARLAISTLSPGTHTATISYKGSGNYKASTATVRVTVTKAATVIATQDVSIAYKDSNGELVASIVSEHGKSLVVNLNVELNGKTYTVRTDSNGQASLAIDTLKPGTYTATISYKGSSNYKASTATAKVTVTKADTIISAQDVSIAYKDPNGEVIATIVNEHGKPLVVSLNVNINGKDYTVRTDSNGQASLPIDTLKPGTYTATISYKGSNNYKATSTTAKVTVSKSATVISAPDVAVAYNDPNGKLVSTITNEHGKPLVVNLNVDLNGKTYTARTDSNGQISVSTADLAPGTYTAAISYKGSGNYKASSTTANIQVN